MPLPIAPDRIYTRRRLLDRFAKAVPGRADELDLLCRMTRAQFNVAAAMVTLVSDSGLRVIGHSNPDMVIEGRENCFFRHTVQSDAVFSVADATKDPRFRDHPIVTGRHAVRFYAGAPLVYLDGVRLGALCLIDRERRHISAGEQAELHALAERVVAFIGRMMHGLHFPSAR